MIDNLRSVWRPVLMLWFGVLIGLHWFGYTPESLEKEESLALLEILKVGVGSYIIGRSGEKIVAQYTAKTP